METQGLVGAPGPPWAPSYWTLALRCLGPQALRTGEWSGRCPALSQGRVMSYTLLVVIDFFSSRLS